MPMNLKLYVAAAVTVMMPVLESYVWKADAEFKFPTMTEALAVSAL
jgi:hypothetical protein